MSEEQKLPVGQEEVDHNTTFNEEQINLIEDNGLTLAQVRSHLEEVGPKSLETAIGSLVGKGESTQPASEEAPAEEPAPEAAPEPSEEAPAEEAPAEEPSGEEAPAE